MKRWIWALVAVLVAVGGFFAYQAYSRAKFEAQIADLQTVEASAGELTATVGATGTVRANQSAMLSFETSGRVQQVKVAVGERVAEGQELATLAPDSLPAQVILAQADLVAAQRALDDLLNFEMERAQAQMALAQARDNLESAEYKWRVQQQGYRASSDTIKAAEANLVLAEQEVDAAEAAYNRLSGRPEDDPSRALALSNLVAARKKRDSILRQLNWYKGKPTDTDQMLLDAELAIAQAQLADAEREWERLKDGPDPDDVAAARARLAAAQATLESASITAPFAGTITLVEVKPGDQVAPGTVAFGLADLSQLMVDVEVSEVDINRVQVGQPVTLAFDAVSGKEYNGVVEQVALTGTVVQGVVNFKVTVRITDADELVKPGMTAAVNIVVERLQGVLLVPNRAVRVREGQRVVYVLRGSVPEAVAVELGASSDLYSEVVGGDLQEGDEIVLNPPTTFEQAGHPPFLRR